MNKKVVFGVGVVLVAAIIAVVWVLVGSPSAEKSAVKPVQPSGQLVYIGLSLGTLSEERWATDRDLFVASAKALGAEVAVEAANADADEQLLQAEKLINKGVQVLVVVPQDAEKAAQIVEMAHRAGVKVIAYDRLIRNSDLDMYVSFDSVAVGRMEAEGVVAKVAKGDFAYIGGSPTDNNAFLVKQGSMGVLQPLIDRGDVKLVLDEFTPNWQPDLAYKTVKDFLARGGHLDAVVAANDGTAFGVVRALAEKGLAGKVPVSGQDAELSALRRLVSGEQAVTVYKPIQALADRAAAIAVAMASGENVETNGTANNGRLDVPSYLLVPTMVTADNLDATVIKDGFHSHEEVYEDDASAR